MLVLFSETCNGTKTYFRCVLTLLIAVALLDTLWQSVRGIAAQSPHQRMSRALVKTLCYRVLMIVITVLVALVVTGNTGEALSIGLAANVVKTGTYYGYERLWDRISWGVGPSEA